MNGFSLRIVSPDGVIFDDEAESITLRVSEGDITIQKDHADFTSTFGITPVRIKAGSDEKNAACSDGFLTVSKNVVTVVATTFEFADTIDLARAEIAKERAETSLSDRSSDIDFSIAEMKLKRAILRINVAKGFK